MGLDIEKPFQIHVALLIVEQILDPEETLVVGFKILMTVGSIRDPSSERHIQEGP
jgi:hypothetical protein